MDESPRPGRREKVAASLDIDPTLHYLEEGIAFLDREARVKYINPAGARLFKRRLGQAPQLGESYLDYVHESRLELTRTIIVRAFAEKEPTVFELKYPQGRREAWFQLGYYPVMDAEGEVLHVLVKAKEITTQVRLKARLKKERKLQKDHLIKSIVEAQERERRTIGRELHDNVNQILTTVKLYNEICLSEEQTNKALLQKSIQQINNAISEIRSLSHRLSPVELSGLNLVDSLKELAESVRLTQRLEVRFLTYGLNEKLMSASTHTTLYRVAQEHFTNILKHAEASSVEVILVGTSSTVALSMTDNGKGFDAKLIRKGVGLLSMKTRIQALGGGLDLQTAPGKGCTLMIELPLKG